MPELPEVETIVSDLRGVLPGMCFENLDFEHENSVLGALDLENELQGKKVEKVERRGKYINIFFEGNKVMTIHLRMSGRLIFADLGEPAFRFERTRINFDKGSLRFCDIRKFGKVWINRVEDFEEKTGIIRLGIEPLSEDFSFVKFREIFGRKKGSVKKNLLDQSLMAGVGNIYADEACFYAGIRPNTAIEKLDEKQLEKLFLSVIKALKQGIRNRGTSISDFVDAYGKNGKNQEVLFVYGRGKMPCMKCGAMLLKTVVAGRGTVYCGSCQN